MNQYELQIAAVQGVKDALKGAGIEFSHAPPKSVGFNEWPMQSIEILSKTGYVVARLEIKVEIKTNSLKGLI